MEDSKNYDNYLKWSLVVIFLAILIFLITKENFFNKKIDNSHQDQASELKLGLKYVKIAGKLIKVEVALSPTDQERGLSGKISLGEDEGMLFIFDHMDKYAFWMKGMNFPLDIIWISDDMKVVYIKKNALPGSFPDTFAPDQNARYVLEVKALFGEKNNLKVGDKVEFLSS